MTGYKKVTATTNLKTKPGFCTGIFVSAASATPTIQLTDGAGGEVIIDTFTPVAATMYNFGDLISTKTGLTIVISGTVVCTPFFD